MKLTNIATVLVFGVFMVSVKVIIEEKNVSRFLALQHATSEDKQIHENILRAIEKLKIDPYHGRSIRKKQIPACYKTYKNLWREKLTKNWRILYSVKNVGKDANCDDDDDVIEVIIVDWMPHKEYDRLFYYD